MTQERPFEPSEGTHDYSQVGPASPGRWVLAAGAILVLAAVLAAFYGLYTINRDGSPTLTPDPIQLTRRAVAAAETPQGTTAGEATPSATPTGTPSATLVISPTVEPVTYTVRSGDTLIAIAARFKVDVETLKTLNQITGETIYPDQVLLVPATATPRAEGGPFYHKVNAGETLISIAAFYQVTVDELKSLNGLISDTILAGQDILIPASGVQPPTPTPTPEPWSAAVISGELDAVYSLSTIKGHFTLHIPPDTRAADRGETAKIATLVERALEHTEMVLQRPFTGRFDVFVAGTLFNAPFTGWRSLSLPEDNRIFLLYDGSGTPSERLYWTTFAATQLVAAQKLGEAAAPLLREGLATYAGGKALEDEVAQGRTYLSPAQFCAALEQAGKLPRVSGELTPDGQLGRMTEHMAAGCFVGYLIEAYGSASFNQVYRGGDYRAVYDRTLGQLESDWTAAMRDAAPGTQLDGEELAQVTLAVDGAYQRLWSDFTGASTQFAAYERLDRARLALLQGRLSAAREHLAAFESLLGEH